MKEKIIIKCNLCPGDLCTLTAAIYSLHVKYKNQYVTDVRTHWPSIFNNNPHITPLQDKEARSIEAHYTDLIDASNTVPVPFLLGYTQNLSQQLGIRLTLVTNKPQLYLNSEEEKIKLFSEPFLLINAGTKRDVTCKQWPVEYYQAVVDQLKDKIKFIQVGNPNDNHVALKGVINWVGRTPARKLIILASQSMGGIGPVTWLQHLCAAFEKPYFCLLGGREGVSWVQYPFQQTFHVMGQLDCCSHGGCWNARVVPLSKNEENLCECPQTNFKIPAPRCMTMIKPEQVIMSLHTYLDALRG